MPAKKKSVIVAVSGGFDPIHIGHIRMLKEAKALGDKLVVIINNDNWLIKKKNYIFMPQNERKEIIENISHVDKVILTKHKKNPEDMSVCATLLELKPNIFANGGDRQKSNIPEIKTCQDIDCKCVFNVGYGGKIQSSSWLIDRFFAKYMSGDIYLTKEKADIMRPWGGYTILKKTNNYWVKKLFINKDARLSLQSHEHREEIWFVLSGKIEARIGNKSKKIIPGEVVFVPKNTKHRIMGITNSSLLEVAFGKVLERDIARYEDDYNRA